MKLNRLTLASTVAIALSAGIHAQMPKTETELKVKDGKDVTIVGCIEQNEGGKFLLTHAADKKNVRPDYVLATDEDLSKYVGHRVQISGIAADRGDGKVEIKSTTKTDVKHGDDTKIESKSEIKGDMGQMRYLSVKNLKTLAVTCR